MPRPGTITLIVFLMFAIAFWKTASISPTASASNEIFTDITEQAGITWQQFGGESQDRFLIETMGGGVAFFDFDNDGLLDIFFVNGGETPHGKSPLPLSNALYRNLGNGRFENVAAKAGVDKLSFYGMGVTAADFDNDGYQDVYITGYPASALFHNNGDGTFTDVSKASGIGKYPGKAWGAVATDINNDGLLDLFVGNDTVLNFLFKNVGQGRFEEIATQAGVAYSADGRARSGMGVDSADFNEDGWMDLFVANIDREMFSIYQNNHDETFDDLAGPTGIGAATRLMSGWGLKFFDYDNDGNLDLFLANGNPDDLIESLHSQVMYQEPLMLFRNTGKSFQNVSAESGPAFAKPLSARGMAIGDFDNDGAVDVLVSVNDGAPMLLRNNVGSQNHWLGIRLVGKKSNPDAIGARINYQAGDLKRSRMKVGGGSYLSSHDPRIVLGIGKRPKTDWLEIKWPQPGGAVERFTELPVNRYITIVEGKGKWG